MANTGKRAGDIYRWDSQSDVFGGQYKLIRSVGGGRWEIEHMPADDVTEGLILDHWASVEARGGRTSPIWDKTWAECADGEEPQRIGALTYAQELDRELARYADRAGTRTEIRFVSAAEHAKHF